VRNCPEVDMVGLTGSVVFTAWCNVETLYVETHGGEVRRKHVEFVVLLGDVPKVNAPPNTSLRGSTSTSDRTAFGNFGGTTATDNQSSLAQRISVLTCTTEPGYKYRLWWLQISR
jgi:hypothetical protein